MRRNVLLCFLTALTLLCCGCAHSNADSEAATDRAAAANRPEPVEIPQYQRGQQFIQDNALEETYPEVIIKAVDQGSDSCLYLTLPDFMPQTVTEIEALAKEKDISVRAVSENIYGIAGEYADGLWTLKGYYFDPAGGECKDYPKTMDSEAACALYEERYKNYAPNEATLTQLMMDACRMVSCADEKLAATKYRFRGGYYFLKFYEQIEELDSVKLHDNIPYGELFDLAYPLCQYYTPPLDQRDSYVADNSVQFLYYTGDLLINTENYQCSLYRDEQGVYGHCSLRHRYLSDAEDDMFDVFYDIFFGTNRCKLDMIDCIKRVYYVWNYTQPGTWPGKPIAKVEEGDKVAFLYGDITRMVWDRKTDEVWIERNARNHRAEDEYTGRYLVGAPASPTVPGSNAVIYKDGESYHVDVQLVNQASLSLSGYEEDGKLILTETEEGYNMEAELVKGEKDNTLVLRIIKNPHSWLQEGEEIEFYRL